LYPDGVSLRIVFWFLLATGVGASTAHAGWGPGKRLKRDSQRIEAAKKQIRARGKGFDCPKKLDLDYKVSGSGPFKGEASKYQLVKAELAGGKAVCAYKAGTTQRTVTIAETKLAQGLKCTGGKLQVVKGKGFQCG
jgi:hypothetical protein